MSLHASSVHQTQYHQLPANQSQHVNATLDSREQMEAPARSAVSTNTNKSWDRLVALVVHQTVTLQQAASQSQHVSASVTLPCPWASACATLGLRDQVDSHVYSAQLAHTKRTWVLVLANLVWPTQSLLLEV